MTAIQLLHLFDLVFLVAMAGWVGSILFFSFGVAPVIFAVLPADHAARFVRTLFPRYYTWGAVAGAIALPAAVCGPLAVPELRGPRVAAEALMILVGIGLMLGCGNVLTPAINAARDAGPTGQARFDRLHRRSVRLNAVALALGLAVLALYAWRPPVVSSGIVEPGPRLMVTEGGRAPTQAVPGEPARPPAPAFWSSDSSPVRRPDDPASAPGLRESGEHVSP